ncbi:MAG: glycosyltransferase [Clostridia bacterium]|nr:glycosyltransferase [Clostridia bacterium]
MKKVLFLIHDLGVGGAEKVLVNLVNRMDKTKFDVTVISLFGGGVNEKFLKKSVHYKAIFKKAFPANSKILKLFSPKRLHKWFIKEKYDVEISYLEGPSARIISGCMDQETKLVCWIHVEQHTKEIGAGAFRSYAEAKKCYERFDKTICVSEYVKNDFSSIFPDLKNLEVLYNTNATEEILEKMNEPVEEGLFKEGEIKLCGVGKIVPVKGFDKLARLQKRLREEGYNTHFYALGVGPEQERIEQYTKENGISEYYTFLGYQTNPYKYVAKCDLFLCASTAEGFSTAATESLIVGTPVVTVDVSGMKEMLGENGEYGIVTPQSEEALYQAVKGLLDEPKKLKAYKKKAKERGLFFSAENTVKAVEEMLEKI